MDGTTRGVRGYPPESSGMDAGTASEHGRERFSCGMDAATGVWGYRPPSLGTKTCVTLHTTPAQRNVCNVTLVFRTQNSLLSLSPRLLRAGHVGPEGPPALLRGVPEGLTKRRAGAAADLRPRDRNRAGQNWLSVRRTPADRIEAGQAGPRRQVPPAAATLRVGGLLVKTRAEWAKRRLARPLSRTSEGVTGQSKAGPAVAAQPRCALRPHTGQRQRLSFPFGLSGNNWCHPVKTDVGAEGCFPFVRVKPKAVEVAYVWLSCGWRGYSALFWWGSGENGGLGRAGVMPGGCSGCRPRHSA